MFPNQPEASDDGVPRDNPPDADHPTFAELIHPDGPVEQEGDHDRDGASTTESERISADAVLGSDRGAGRYEVRRDGSATEAERIIADGLPGSEGGAGRYEVRDDGSATESSRIISDRLVQP